MNRQERKVGWALPTINIYINIKNMKDYHINIFYSEEDEGYIAEIPDLKFCSAWGATPAISTR